MDRNSFAARQEVIATCLKMNQVGINQGTSGNVSIRWEDGFLITPSGMPYEQMLPDDVVYVGLNGIWSAQRMPSTEWRFHKDIYSSRPDIQAIVHTHSTYATAIAICGESIPAVHYMVAASGGHTIPCAPYATYGTQALSDHVVEALQARDCCLLANHGVIATGKSLAKALWLAKEVEAIAKQYTIARQFGKPVVLPDEEIGVVLEKFKSYGLQPNQQHAPLPA